MKKFHYCVITIGILSLSSIGNTHADPLSYTYECNDSTIFNTLNTIDMSDGHPIPYSFLVDNERYFIDAHEAIFSKDMMLTSAADSLPSGNSIKPAKSKPSAKVAEPSMPLLILVGLIGIGSIPRKWAF